MLDARFQHLIEAVRHYAIFFVDRDGYVQSWNMGAELAKGYRGDEIIGRHIETFYTPEDRTSGRPAALLAEAAARGCVEDEGWRVRKDGTRFWADVVITAVHDDAGRLEGYTTVSRDLTDRRITEEQLRASEERFRLLVEGVKDYAIYLLDPAGRVATWNAGAERIKGYTATEILGKHVQRFYDADDVRARAWEREFEVAVREGRFEDERWRVRKDGTRFWANVVITPLHSSTGELIGFAEVTRDLTERRRAEDERLRLAQAQEAIRLRDEFLSIASHELKTPLTALQLQLQDLRRRMETVDAPLAKRLAKATRSGERLAALIESLLDVSRIATGRFTLNFVRFDLVDVAQQVIENLRGAAVNAGCELSLQVTTGIPGRWDPLRIEQVLTNLLSNAMKYGAGAPVAVAVARAGDRAILEVRDRGPGIAEQDVSRIFGRFERAGSMEHHGGLGLGLYVTRQIVEAHGGSVAVENPPEGGACFRVELPTDPVTTGDAKKLVLR